MLMQRGAFSPATLKGPRYTHLELH